MKSRPNSNYILQVMRDSFGDGDPWGTAMAWGFAVAETLTVVGAEVPAEMDYSPSPFVQVETPETYSPESYEDDVVFEYLRDATDLESAIREVQFAGKCLARYINWLDAAGFSY